MCTEPTAVPGQEHRGPEGQRGRGFTSEPRDFLFLFFFFFIFLHFLPLFLPTFFLFGERFISRSSMISDTFLLEEWQKKRLDGGNIQGEDVRSPPSAHVHEHIRAG